MILLALALAQAHQPTGAEIAMVKCFYSQAAALDDHVSSAAVIARGVTSACGHEVGDWKFDSLQYVRAPDLHLFFDELDRAALGYATEVVLKVRARH